MADETLSLRVEFGEIEKFKSDLEAAQTAVLSLGNSAASINGSFENLSAVILSTGSALDELTKLRTAEIDIGGIEDAGTAAKAASEDVKTFARIAEESGIQADKSFASVANALEDVAKTDLGAARHSLQEIADSADSANSSFADLTAASGEVATSLNAIPARIFDVDTQDIVQDFSALNTELEDAASRFSDVQDQASQTGTTFHEVSNEASEFGVEAKEATQGLASGGVSALEPLNLVATTLGGVINKVELLKVATAALGTGLGFLELAHIAKEMRQAFEEAEDAVAGVTIALASLGKLTEGSVGELERLASEVQRMTIFNKDAILGVAALVAQLAHLSGEPLERVTRAAVELAAITGRDLNSAALALIRVANGSASGIQRMGFAIDDTVPKGKLLEEVLKQIEKNAGTAAFRADTLSGSIIKLGNAWKTFLGIAGSSFSVLEPEFGRIQKFLDDASEKLERRGLGAKAASDFEIAIGRVRGQVDELLAKRGEMEKFGKVIRFPPFFVGDSDKLIKDLESRLDETVATLDKVIKFHIDNGPIEESERLLKKVGLAAQDVDVALGKAFGDKLRAIQKAGEQRLIAKVGLDTKEAEAGAEGLGRFIQALRPAITVILDDEDLNRELKTVRDRRSEILATVELDPGTAKSLDDDLKQIKLHGPELDQGAFDKAAERFASEFRKEFQAGITDAGGAGSAAAAERALKLLGILEELKKQRQIRIDTRALDEAQKKARDAKSELQETIGINFSTNAGEIADSSLPKVVSVVEQIQDLAKDPIAFRFDLGDLLAETGNAAAALDALDQAIGRVLSQHDPTALVAAKKALEDFVRDPAIQAAFDTPTMAVRTRVSEILKSLDTELARLGPQLKARELTLTFHAQFEAGDIDGLTTTVADAKALVKEKPELRPFVNLTDLENGVLQAESLLSPLTEERGLETRLKFAVDTGNLDLALATLQQIKEFEQRFPEFKPAIDISDLEDSILQIQSVGDEFQHVMAAIDTGTQLITTSFLSGWDAAANQLKKIFADLVADILKKLARLAFFKFLGKGITFASLGPAAGFLPFKPGGFKEPAPGPGPAPEPAPRKAVAPPPAVGPAIVELKPPRIEAPKIAPIRAPVIAAPDIPELKAPIVKAPKFPAVQLDKIELPPLPPLRLAPLSVPDLPELKAPALRVPKIALPQLPKLEAPRVLFPRLPRLEAPEIAVPEFPPLRAPRILLPELPELRAPVLKLPEFPAVAARIAPADVRRLLPPAPELVRPVQELPTVSFARLETSRAIDVSTQRPASERVEPRSILRRKAGPDVQVTFQGAFDGESVRRQFQSGSINRELVRMSRRGRL